MEILCRELGRVEIKGLNWRRENLPPRQDWMNVGKAMCVTANGATLRKVLLNGLNLDLEE